MNKKMNTVIFVIVGTLVNIILAIAFVVILVVLAGFARDLIGPAKSVILPFIVFLGIFLAMMLYQKLTMWVIKRFNLEDKLDPLFVSKRRKNS
jgi:ABC-type methionine transport system permease subunit